MTSFEDAFVKAGIIKESDILLKEQQKKKEEQEKKQQALKEEDERREKSKKEWQEIQNQMALFENLWKGEKSHKFLAHLVYAFTPGNTCHFAWNNEELKSKSCCICKHKLISKETLLAFVPKISEISISQITRELNGELTPEQKFKEFESRIFNICCFCFISKNTFR